jgi:ABC-2 type transport system permease protein
MLMVMIMLPLVLLSGFLSAIDTLPAAFQQLTMANPIRHYLDILRSVYLKGTGVGDMGIQFGALATIAGGTLLLATNRFRRSIG